MSYELISVLASVGTFVVIAVTGIAALVQLRHMRGSNQIVAFSEIRARMESPEFMAAVRFVRIKLPELLRQPAVRKEIMGPWPQEVVEPANLVALFFENIGTFVRRGIIDKDIALDLWSPEVLACWKGMAPLIAIDRRGGGQAAWENFEYLAQLSRSYMKQHPHGLYPKELPRMQLDDPYLAADVAAGLVKTESQEPPAVER